MSDAFDRERFEGQQLVFSLGDPGDSAYVIEEGCVEVLVGHGESQRRVAILTEGAMFGEVALLDGQPRTASVRTLVPTRLIRIDRGNVEELLLRADPVIQYLLRLLLERFRSAHDAGPPANPALRSVAVAERLHDSVDLHKAAVRTLSLAQDLSDAIDRNQLELFYQPLLSFSDASLVGFEALLRWRHPTLGMVNPMEFIALAEKTGLIHRIGHWVLQRAALDWAELRQHALRDGQDQPFVSVNLSAPELSQAGIVQAVHHALAQQAMRPEELHIELTETAIIHSMAPVSTALHQLRELGVGIALDDFGTGYAGLDYLQTLPFSCLKIDKTFVQQINRSERSLHIVKAALELANSIGLTTIAEGIEDAATGAVLATMGCSLAQGFHFARPMPKGDVAAWLAGHRLLRLNPTDPTAGR